MLDDIRSKCTTRSHRRTPCIPNEKGKDPVDQRIGKDKTALLDPLVVILLLSIR